MKFTLNKDIALRSWRLVPYAYYQRGIRNAQGLSKEEYEFLVLCDGKHDLEESALSVRLMGRGLIQETGESGALTDWQKPLVCDNRYFPAINWMITGKCNFNCLHCFNAADNGRIQSEFTLEEAEKLISEAGQCGINGFTITGGEPMMHPNFIEILRSIYSKGMYVYELNTNGHFITQAVLDEMKALGSRPLMKVSFDGIGHHDWLRSRKGAEEEALSAMKLCIKNGFEVKAQTNVHRLNADSMLPTAELLSSMGVSEMRIIRTTEAPRWRENAGDACLELTEYYDRMLEFTEEYAARELPMDIDLWQFLQFSPRSRRYHYRPVEGGCHSFRESAPVCRGNRGMIAIGADGSLMPCLQMSGYLQKNGIQYGNSKTSPLQALLQEGDYMDAVTCTVAKLYERNEACRSCEYKKLCAGGCRAVATGLTDDYFGIDPSKCLYFKNGYMQKTDEVFSRIAGKSGITYENMDDVR